VDDTRVQTAKAFASGQRPDAPAGTAAETAALALALAASPSPARVHASTVEACERGDLAPAAIVEVVTWLAVLQLLHRLTCYLTPPA
jgi:hypothetical protein